MSLGPRYVFLGEVFVQVLCPFFNWVVCLPEGELCEFLKYLGDQTFVQGIICKYIFPYGLFPVHFVALFFGCAADFIVMKSHLFILSFMSLALGNISMKMLLCGVSEIFLPMFSCRTFMVS